MLKAKTSDGKVIFGLCEENIKHLKAGRPLVVKDENFPHTLIYYTEHQEDLAPALKEMAEGVGVGVQLVSSARQLDS